MASVALGAGALALGSGAAGAQVADGNDAAVTVSLPVVVCGTGIGVLGTAVGSCPPATTAAPAPLVAIDPGAIASGSVLSGNDALVSVDAPVTVCGNAVGSASGSCVPASGSATPPSSTPAPATTAPAGTPATAPATTAPATAAPASGGVVSGLGIGAGVNVPVTVCGNAVGVLGSSDAGCAADTPSTPSAAVPPAAAPPATLPSVSIPPVLTAPVPTAAGSGGPASVLGGSPTVAGPGMSGGPASSPAADAAASPEGVERLAMTGAVLGIAALLGAGVLLVGSGGLGALVAKVRAS
jgi:hypothetical protein